MPASKILDPRDIESTLLSTFRTFFRRQGFQMPRTVASWHSPRDGHEFIVLTSTFREDITVYHNLFWVLLREVQEKLNPLDINLDYLEDGEIDYMNTLQIVFTFPEPEFSAHERMEILRELRTAFRRLRSLAERKGSLVQISSPSPRQIKFYFPNSLDTQSLESPTYSFIMRSLDKLGGENEVDNELSKDGWGHTLSWTYTFDFDISGVLK